MKTLEEWLKSDANTLPNVVQNWAGKLIELGASWDTFRLDKHLVHVTC